MNSIYHELRAKIKVTVNLSNRIQLRGSRQGCCLSPLLLALYVEPLVQEMSDLQWVHICGKGHIN